MSSSTRTGKSPERAGEHIAPTTATDEQLLAQMGYKQEFKREFSMWSVVGIAYNIVGLMPSIALTLSYSIPSAGPVGLVWGWTIGCFFILTTALAMADLASAMPTSGGLYYWTFAYAPENCRVFLAYVCGIFNTLSTTAATASITWGVGQFIFSAYTTMNPDSTWEPTSWQYFLVFLGMMILEGVVTCVGTGILARVQFFYMLATTGVALAVIIALPAATPSDIMNSAKFAFTYFYNSSGYSSVGAFFISLLMPAWTVASFDACVHISEEASNAAFAVPFGITAAVAMAGVLGWACVVAISFCMGSDLDSISDADEPLSVILVQSFGEKGFLAIWILFILTTYMMGQSMSLASSRQIFAFSRDGALPFSKWVHRINKHTKTPVNSVWYSTFISIILGCIGIGGSTASSAIFSLSIIGCSVAYGLPVAARLLGPKQNFTPGPWYLGNFWSPIVGWTAVIWEAFILVIAHLPTYLPTDAPDMNYAVVVTGSVCIFIIVSYFMPKYGARNWFHGPKTTIGDGVTLDIHDMEGTAPAHEGEKSPSAQDGSSSGASMNSSSEEKGVKGEPVAQSPSVTLDEYNNNQ